MSAPFTWDAFFEATEDCAACEAAHGYCHEHWLDYLSHVAGELCAVDAAMTDAYERPELAAEARHREPRRADFLLVQDGSWPLQAWPLCASCAGFAQLDLRPRPYSDRIEEPWRHPLLDGYTLRALQAIPEEVKR